MRELLDAQPDEIWVIQINQSRMRPRPKEPEPGDEPTSVVEILDRRNALAGNLSLNQELRHLEEITTSLSRSWAREKVSGSRGCA